MTDCGVFSDVESEKVAVFLLHFQQCHCGILSQEVSVAEHWKRQEVGGSWQVAVFQVSFHILDEQVKYQGE